MQKLQARAKKKTRYHFRNMALYRRTHLLGDDVLLPRHMPRCSHPQPGVYSPPIERYRWPSSGELITTSAKITNTWRTVAVSIRYGYDDVLFECLSKKKRRKNNNQNYNLVDCPPHRPLHYPSLHQPRSIRFDFGLAPRYISLNVIAGHRRTKR